MKVRIVSMKEIAKNDFILSPGYYLDEKHIICKCLMHIKEKDKKFKGKNGVYCSTNCLEKYDEEDDLNE